MAYRKATREELEQYIKNNPSGSYRINGQEVRPEKTYEDEEGQDWFMKLLTGISKPFRAIPGSIAGAISGKEDYDNPFLTQREEESFREDPTKWGTKQAAGLGAYLVPGGSNALTAGKRIAGAAAKGAGAGALGGFSVSDDEDELASILKGAGLGGLIGGAFQGVGEISKGIKSAKLAKASGADVDVYLDSLDNVKKIGELPDKARGNLKTLSKTAGFNDPKLSDSKNILNYLNNRKLAGTTPGQTLENMTQEFEMASRLKKEGIEEIGGLSRDYLKQARNNFDDAITHKGLVIDPESKTVYKQIVDAFEKGPQDAKSLDKIIIKWNEAGRLAKGAQKTSLNGLYVDAQKALRDTLRSTNVGGKYDTALKSLSQILGLDDVGVVSASTSMAEKSGINLPMFQNAGFTGTDIKMPFIANTISKGQAGIAQRQLAKNLPISVGQQGAAEIPQALQGILGMGQRALPPMAGQLAGQPQGQQEIQGQPQALQQSGVSNDEFQALNMALAEAIFSGEISSSDAEAIMGLLGMGGGGDGGSRTESQMDYATAASALEQSYQVLETTGGAGKIPTALGGISEFFGGTTASTEYSASLEIATALIRKALIGAGQTEIELKNLNLPTPNDEPAVAKMKIESILPILRQRAGL